ncbi:MAG: acetate kinase [Candidatus Omnitrophota bacterium]
MKILIINCGSSSVKFQLFEKNITDVVIKGKIECIGQKLSILKYQIGNAKLLINKIKVVDYNRAISVILDVMTMSEHRIIQNIKEISAIGHRVVHAGEHFQNSVVITGKVLHRIKQCFKLAPLHNLPAYLGILACRKVFPKVLQVAVFDTAFYQLMPQYAYLYALPYNYYRKYRIRRYGFHGTSHRYVAEKAAEILKKPLNSLKLITAHLGNGCSITAVDKGRAVDTSMGFTPLEGLVMGTRCGDIDASIVFFLLQKEALSLTECEEILNKKSGLLGISGQSSDMREIIKYMHKKHKRSHLAWKIFIYRLKKYIGAYVAAMNGVDAVVFTAGISENYPRLIQIIKRELSFLLKNAKIFVVPTNEELFIAQETKRLKNRTRIP